MKLGRPFFVVTGLTVLSALASFNEITQDAQASSPSQPIAARIADAESRAPPGNPLWAIPLEQLSITRERPIFSPSRRPPPSVAPVTVQQSAIKVPEPKLERPAVSLLGTVMGTDIQMGIFLETATKNVIRLRVGEDHQGWMMRLIKAREVTLIKNRNVVVLELRPSGGSPAPDGPTMPPPVPDGVPGVATGPIVSTANYADEQPNIR